MSLFGPSSFFVWWKFFGKIVITVVFYVIVPLTSNLVFTGCYYVGVGISNGETFTDPSDLCSQCTCRVSNSSIWETRWGLGGVEPSTHIFPPSLPILTTISLFSHPTTSSPLLLSPIRRKLEPPQSIYSCALHCISDGLCAVCEEAVCSSTLPPPNYWTLWLSPVWRWVETPIIIWLPDLHQNQNDWRCWRLEMNTENVGNFSKSDSIGGRRNRDVNSGWRPFIRWSRNWPFDRSDQLHHSTSSLRLPWHCFLALFTISLIPLITRNLFIFVLNAINVWIYTTLKGYRIKRIHLLFGK